MSKDSIDKVVLGTKKGVFRSNPSIDFEDFLKGKTEIHSNLVGILIDVAAEHYVDFRISKLDNYNQISFRPIYSENTNPDEFLSDLQDRVKPFCRSEIYLRKRFTEDNQDGRFTSDIAQIDLYDNLRQYNITISFDNV